MERETHGLVDKRFQKYFNLFEQSALDFRALQDANRELMIKMGDTLDDYMTAIERDPAYISFEILNSNLENPDSVEALYQQIEKKIEENRKAVKFE